VRGEHVDLVTDPNGAFEIHSCQSQPQFTGSPLLKVELRQIR
jgi:hypothetical protein